MQDYAIHCRKAQSFWLTIFLICNLLAVQWASADAWSGRRLYAGDAYVSGDFSASKYFGEVSSATVADASEQIPQDDLEYIISELWYKTGLAYSQRNYWDGGSTNLVPATGRTSLQLDTYYSGIAHNHGTGTVGTIPKFTGVGTFGDSLIQESGFSVGIGSTVSSARFNIDHTGTYGFYMNDSLLNPSSFSYRSYGASYPVYTGAGSVTRYFTGLQSVIYPIINGEHTNSGYQQAIGSGVLRNSTGALTDDNGTLSSMIGLSIDYGHNNTNPSAVPATTNAYGLIITPLYRTGTITNMYDVYISNAVTGSATTPNRWSVYQADTSSRNYFSGKVGIKITTPLADLDVNGSARIVASSLSTQPSHIATQTGSDNVLKWQTWGDFINNLALSGEIGGGNIGGTGSAGYVAKFIASATLANSIFQDDGTNAGVGTGPMSGVKLNVDGNVNIRSGSKYKIGGIDLAYSNVGAAAEAHNHGTGTVGRIPKYTSTTGFGDSIITEIEGLIGINNTSPDLSMVIGGGTSNGQIGLGGGKGYAYLGSSRGDGGLFLGKNIYSRFIDSNDNGKAFVGVNSSAGLSGAFFTTNGSIQFFGKSGSVVADEQANVAANQIMSLKNGEINVSGVIKYPDTYGDKLILKPNLYGVNIDVNEFNLFSDRYFTMSSDTNQDAFVFDADTGDLTIKGKYTGDGSGLSYVDADTLGGYSANDFVKRAGDSMYGDLTMWYSQIIFDASPDHKIKFGNDYNIELAPYTMSFQSDRDFHFKNNEGLSLFKLDGAANKAIVYSDLDLQANNLTQANKIRMNSLVFETARTEATEGALLAALERGEVVLWEPDGKPLAMAVKYGDNDLRWQELITMKEAENWPDDKYALSIEYNGEIYLAQVHRGY